MSELTEDVGQPVGAWLHSARRRYAPAHSVPPGTHRLRVMFTPAENS
jgi:hypothetical protein